MAAVRIPLAQLRVENPCPVPWSTMTGGDASDRSRFCAHCDRHVHNLSAMTASAAEKLVCESAGRLCVAYYPNPDGSPKTLDYQPPPAKRRFGWKFIAVLASIGAVGASAARTIWGPQAPPAATAVMLGRVAVAGMIAPPTTRNVPVTPPKMIQEDIALPANQSGELPKAGGDKSLVIGESPNDSAVR